MPKYADRKVGTKAPVLPKKKLSDGAVVTKKRLDALSEYLPPPVPVEPEVIEPETIEVPVKKKRTRKAKFLDTYYSYEDDK